MTRSHLLLTKTGALAAVRYAILHDRHVLAAAFGSSDTLEHFVASIVTTTSNRSTPFASLILTLPESADPISTDDLVAMIERGASSSGIEAVLAIVHGPPMEDTRPHAHIVVRFSPAIHSPKRQLEKLKAFAGVIARRLDGGHFIEPSPKTHGRRKPRRDRANSLALDEWLIDVHHVDDLVLQARWIEDVNQLLQIYHLDYKLTANGATISTRSSNPTHIKASSLHLSPKRLLAIFQALPSNLPTRYIFDYDRDKNEKYAPAIVTAWKEAHRAWSDLYDEADKAQLANIRGRYLPRYRAIAKEEKLEKKTRGAISTEILDVHRALLLDQHCAEQERAMSRPPKPHSQIGTWLRNLTDSNAPVASAEGVAGGNPRTTTPWLPTGRLGAIDAWYDHHRRVATLDSTGRLTILAAKLVEHQWSDLPLSLSRPLALHPHLSPEERAPFESLGPSTTMRPVAVSDTIERMLRQPYHFEPAIQRTLLRANGLTWLTATTNPDQIRELRWKSRSIPAAPGAGVNMPLQHQRATLPTALEDQLQPKQTTTPIPPAIPPTRDQEPRPPLASPQHTPPRFDSAQEAWDYIDRIHPTAQNEQNTPLPSRDPQRVNDDELYTYLTPHPVDNLAAAPDGIFSPHAQAQLQTIFERFEPESTTTRNIIVFFPPDPTPYRYMVRWDDDTDAVITTPLPIVNASLSNMTPEWKARLDRYFDNLRKERHIAPTPLARDTADHYGINQTMIPDIPITHQSEADLYTIVANDKPLPERHLDTEIAEYCRLHGYRIGIETDDFTSDHPTTERTKSRSGRSFIRRKR